MKLILLSFGMQAIGPGYSPLWAQESAGMAFDGYLAKTIVAHGDFIWIATQAGVFRSSDSGKAWIPAPVPNASGGADHLFSVGDRLFLKQGWGLYISGDNGENWVMAPPLPPDFNRMIADGNTLVAGVSEEFDPILSDDKGLNWSLPLEYFPDSSQLLSVYQDDSIIWSATDKGLYYSSDGSASWSQLGLPAPRFVDRKSGRLWTGSDSGLFIISQRPGAFDFEKVPYDGSLSWIPPGGFTEAGGALFVIRKNQTGDRAALYATLDSGKIWNRPRNQGLTPIPDSGSESPYYPFTSVHSLGTTLIAVFNDSYLFYSVDRGETWVPGAGGSFGGHIPGYITDVKVFRDSVAAFVRQVLDYWVVSADSGRSWQRWAGPPVLGLPDHGPWNSPLVPGLENIFASGNHVFAICQSTARYTIPNGYWHSSDKGVTWDSTRGTGYRKRLRLQANLGPVRFESDPRGLMVSIDSGASWSRSLETTAEPTRLLIAGSTHFALAGRSLFASYDSGFHWKQVKFRDDPLVYDIARFADRVFAATNEGLYISADGLTWIPPGRPASLPPPGMPAGEGPPPIVRPRSGREYEFRFRLEKTARISVGLFSAAGNLLGSVSETREPGDQEIKVPVARSVAVFYRMEIKPVETTGHRRIVRGSVSHSDSRR